MGCLAKLGLLSVLVALGAILMAVLVPPEEIHNFLIKHIPSDYADSIINFIPTQEKLVKNKRIYTKEELALYTGSEGSPGLYLAILGQVYDVSKGAKHYGPGGGYSFFSGKDGTRAFVTGEFTDEGLVEDLSGLSSSQLLELQNWLDLYKKDYIFKGYLHGHFYDANGKATAALKQVRKGIKAGNAERQKDKEDEKKFPSCNSEWSQASGSRVWCSEQSGGVNRDWVGVPRQYHRPSKSSTRCACIRTSGPPTDQPDDTSDRGDLDNPNFKLYQGCDPLSVSCILPKKK